MLCDLPGSSGLVLEWILSGFNEIGKQMPKRIALMKKEKMEKTDKDKYS